MHHIKVFGLLFGLALIPAQSQAGTILITEQEASLPNGRGGPIARGITRGPSVELVEPGETVHSPVHFQIKLQAFGGSKINLDPPGEHTFRIDVSDTDGHTRSSVFVFKVVP